MKGRSPLRGQNIANAIKGRPAMYLPVSTAFDLREPSSEKPHLTVYNRQQNTDVYFDISKDLSKYGYVLSSPPIIIEDRMLVFSKNTPLYFEVGTSLNARVCKLNYEELELSALNNYKNRMKNVKSKSSDITLIQKAFYIDNTLWLFAFSKGAYYLLELDNELNIVNKNYVCDTDRAFTGVALGKNEIFALYYTKRYDPRIYKKELNIY